MIPLQSGQGYTVVLPKDWFWAHFSLIYVNDIPSDSQALMFADDTKIFRQIQSQIDFNQFQTSTIFSVKWQLKSKIFYILSWP